MMWCWWEPNVFGPWIIFPFMGIFMMGFMVYMMTRMIDIRPHNHIDTLDEVHRLRKEIDEFKRQQQAKEGH